jgi:hypothetical protein
MMIVMDMSTGEIDKLSCKEAPAEEFGAFGDEVLNAGWLPQPALRLETHDHAARTTAPVADVDAFLRTLYCSQG